MRKHTKYVVIFLCSIYILCSCTQSNQVKDHEIIEANIQYQIKKMPYTVYLQKEIELSPYEPTQGTYLGAYVLSNPEIEYDMKQFEETVGKNMAIALRHYQLGNDFPKQWLLQCLAQNKAPYIVVTPENIKAPYNQKILQDAALQFSNTYGIPVFIEFYPNPKEFEDPKAYISYFQLAKEIFAEYASNAVFVWSVDMDDVYDSMVYYPGDDYVDWIGMSMYFPVYKNDIRYNIDIDQHLDYFYNMYQGKKPLMISKLAVSHYSKKGHTFYIEEANNIINHIYSIIPKYYPRIKGINYIDIDNIKIAPKEIGNDNFTISTEPKMTKIYKEAISNPHYLQSVEDSKEYITWQWVKSRTPIYEWDNKLYVSEEMVLYDWEINIIDRLKNYKMTMDDTIYYKLDDVVKIMHYKYSLKDDVLRIYPKDKKVELW